MAKTQYMDDPFVRKWLDSIMRSQTKIVYKSGLRLFIEYTGLTPRQLVDEALEDVRRDPRERTDVVKSRLIGFYNWCVKEAPRRRAIGKGKIEVVKDKRLSQGVSTTYVNVVRSFYSTFDISVKLKGRSKLPKPKSTTTRLILDNTQVERLVDHTRGTRDRAILWVLFSSGMDVSTLCSLQFKDVSAGLSKKEYPITLHLYRQKSGTEYWTHMSRTAVDALNSYLSDLNSKGVVLEAYDPLFLKGSNKAMKKEAMTENLVMNMMKEVALRAGLIDDKMNGNSFNPLGTHALRESFGSIANGENVSQFWIDFWLGHTMSDERTAYQKPRIEDSKRIYLLIEKFLSKPAIGEATQVNELGNKVKMLEQRLRITEQGLRMTMEALRTYDEIGFDKLYDAYQETIQEESHEEWNKKDREHLLPLVDAKTGVKVGKPDGR